MAGLLATKGDTRAFMPSSSAARTLDWVSQVCSYPIGPKRGVFMVYDDEPFRRLFDAADEDEVSAETSRSRSMPHSSTRKRLDAEGGYDMKADLLPLVLLALNGSDGNAGNEIVETLLLSSNSIPEIPRAVLALKAAQERTRA